MQYIVQFCTDQLRQRRCQTTTAIASRASFTAFDRHCRRLKR